MAKSLSSLDDEDSKRDYTQGKVEGDGKTKASQSNAISSKLVRFVKVPTTDEALEDSAIQPLSHLAAPTVRTLELISSAGKTDMLLSAETMEDMRKYASLLSLVYGGMKFESAEPQPNFLRELPAIVGLLSSDLDNERSAANTELPIKVIDPDPLSGSRSYQIAVQGLREVKPRTGARAVKTTNVYCSRSAGAHHRGCK